jgi:hypothetical protein
MGQFDGVNLSPNLNRLTEQHRRIQSEIRQSVAKAVVRAVELHEESWVLDDQAIGRHGYYSREWDDCAIQACDELGLEQQWRDLVSFLTHGYCEGYDWAEANAKG